MRAQSTLQKLNTTKKKHTVKKIQLKVVTPTQMRKAQTQSKLRLKVKMMKNPSLTVILPLRIALRSYQTSNSPTTALLKTRYQTRFRT